MPTPDSVSTAAGHSNAPWSEALALIDGDLARVRAVIAEQMATPFGSINRLLQDVSAGSGKMLRPALVLLSGQCCGNLNDRHITLAAMAELIHTASLLHDDVLDQARIRRNTATVNVLHGNEAAVLLGDFLLSRVFALGMEFDDPRIGRTFSATAMALCQGELLQNIQRQNWQLDEPTYLDIIGGKTAELFGSCCSLGALAAGADSVSENALRQFGIQLGLAFQITDDLLDIAGREDKAGKTLGTDLDKRKPTLPVIHALQTATAVGRTELLQLLSGANDRPRLIQLLHQSGGLSYARSKAIHLCQEAIRCLESLPDVSSRSALIRLTQGIVGRSA
jgi:octaprenyl-diphosphate synthase